MTSVSDDFRNKMTEWVELKNQLKVIKDDVKVLTDKEKTLKELLFRQHFATIFAIFQAAVCNFLLFFMNTFSAAIWLSRQGKFEQFLIQLSCYLESAGGGIDRRLPFWSG